jgi:phosphatidylinositol alpha-1,6-mannosyltransferase
MIIITTQCFPPDRGGIEALMGGLADALSAEGKEILVFADRIHTRDAVERTTRYSVRRFGGMRPLRRLFKARAVAAAVRANRVEGVFADSWKSGELLATLAVPVSVLVHGTEIPLAPSTSKRRRIERTLARAHTVVVNSSCTASAIEPYLSDGTRRIRLVHPPIGEQIEPSQAALSRVRTFVHSSRPMLLTVARLEERKGIDMVIHAMPEILRVHPGAVYVVAGPGGDLVRLQQLARDRGVGDKVLFVGPVDGEPKAALYALADLFVMPARRVGNSVESFGIAYLEAAWYGVPALAGREGGAADAVRDGETGLLCDATDQADVTRQLLRLLGDAPLRARLGGAAKARARGPAQWTNAIAAYLDALK